MIRRPISRRLMAALFVLLLAPMSGWWFVADLTRPEVLAGLSPRQQSDLLHREGQTRRRLGITFCVAVLVMGGVVVYVRRSMIAPLTDLAGRAREVRGGVGWRSPPDRERPDEIGDLARALDDSVRTLESRAEEAVRFAVGLSHELRTPLAAIKGAAEILGEGGLEDADRSRFVSNITVESARLERLVAGLLDLERARQGQAPAPGRCDLVQTVRSTLDRASPSWTRKGLTVERDLAEGSAPAGIDADRATRVLLGLLENAVKFSPRGGRVRVSVSEAKPGLQLVVEDQGPGVDAEQKDRIFDRAFVGDARAGARGTGLGLAIVRSLVEGARGTVHVEDASDGGARFVVRLPAATCTGLEHH